MFRKLVSHTLIYALGPQLPKIASLFVLPIITKDLTAVDYGVAGIIFAYTGLLGGLKDLGLSVNLANVFYRHPNRWQLSWRQLHGYLAIWAIPYTLVQAIVLFFAVPAEATENVFLIILIYSIPSLIFDSTITIGSRYYQMAQRPLYMATTSAIVGSLTILLNLITISYFKMGYLGWFVSTSIGSLVSFLFYVVPVFMTYKLGPIFRFRLAFIKNQLRISLPMIPHNYSSYLLNTSDRLVMNVMGIKIDKIGLYNIAYTFGNYFDFMGTALGMAVGPMYTKLCAERRERELRIITFLLQVAFLFGSFMVCLWLKEIFQSLISNTELQSGYFLGIIIIMGYNYRPMYWAVINKLAYYERTKYLWRISFTAGVLNLALNFILIPIYGYQVAALTSFVGLMYIGFSGFFLKAYRELENERHFPVAWIIAIVVLTVVVYLLKDVSPGIKAIISVAMVATGCGAFYKFWPVLRQVKL